MAKKKAPAKKARGAKPAKGKPAQKKAKAPRAAKPKQQRLLDDMPKDRVLDQICETIHEAMESTNDAATTIKQEKARALARMANKNTPLYRAHGVELAYVPGDAKIRAKLIDSDEGGEDPGDLVPGEDNGAGDVLDAGAQG